MPPPPHCALFDMKVTTTSPGRVNLIGEHTDYNGGMVLPAALSVSLTATLEPRGDNRLVISADSFDGQAERSFDDPAQGSWSDPAVGALIEARRLGMLASGANVHICSSIPHGAGLSSSAALIVTLLKAARELAGSDLADVDIALAARRVENDYIGVPCGIMDQMAVALAVPGKAMALDTKTLEHRLVALPASHTMVVIHSGVTRNLNEGRYAVRKDECDQARAAFGQYDICLLDSAAIEAAQDVDEIIRRRARHCATEHRRVLAAVEALDSGHIAAFGALMNVSHISMRDDFEISLPAIDALVSDAQSLGAIGARLTGGGFGGCIVACVEQTQRDRWLAELLKAHPKAHFVDQVSAS
jgi:galactokinase